MLSARTCSAIWGLRNDKNSSHPLKPERRASVRTSVRPEEPLARECREGSGSTKRESRTLSRDDSDIG